MPKYSPEPGISLKNWDPATHRCTKNWDRIGTTHRCTQNWDRTGATHRCTKNWDRIGTTHKCAQNWDRIGTTHKELELQSFVSQACAIKLAILASMISFLQACTWSMHRSLCIQLYKHGSRSIYSAKLCKRTERFVPSTPCAVPGVCPALWRGGTLRPLPSMNFEPSIGES